MEARCWPNRDPDQPDLYFELFALFGSISTTDPERGSLCPDMVRLHPKDLVRKTLRNQRIAR